MSFSPSLTRSQRLLHESKQQGFRGSVRRVNLAALNSAQGQGAESLPPPFPPSIRLRRLEQESAAVYQVRLGDAHNNNNNSNNDQFSFQHPLTVEWKEIESDCIDADPARVSSQAAYLEVASSCALSLEAQFIQTLGGSAALHAVATDKGIVVPYSWYGNVAEAIFSKIDKLLEIREKRLSSLPNSSATRNSDLESSVAHRARVATATALLWRMLSQVQGAVPGMNTALSLFEEFILPSVYENIGAVASNSAPISSLSEQIRLLGDETRVKLVTSEYSASKKANASLQRKGEYFRKAIQNWGFHIWRSTTRASKRKAVAMDRLAKWVSRAPEAKLKHLAFHNWRLYTQQQRVVRVSETFRRGLQDFFESSPHEGKANAHVKKLAAAVLSPPEGVDEKPIDNNNNSFNKQLSTHVVPEGGTPLTPMKPSDQRPFSSKVPRPILNDALPPSQRALTCDEAAVQGDASSAIGSVCGAMLAKVRQLDEIGVALRGQVAHQVNTINRLDRQLKDSNYKIDSLMSQLLDLNNQKLALINLLHEKEVDSIEMERTHRRLLSKNKLQLHEPWRRAGLRFVASACGVVLPHNRHDVPNSSEAPRDTAAIEGYDALMLPTPEEETFGRLAPLVVSRACQLPDPMLILVDWVNTCLDQLHDLDGLGDAGPYAARLADISDLCVGTILPRLLYYLALPLYRSSGEMKAPVEDFEANRLRLLTGYDCCTTPPGPSFAASFGDVVRMPSATRLASLLNFASDLVLGRSNAEAHEKSTSDRNVRVFDDDTESDERSGHSPASTAARMYVSGGVTVNDALPNLRQIISPLLLANGCRNTSVTFLAVLYLRFAHPFNHKAIVQQVEEEQILRRLAEEALESRAAAEQAMLSHREACDGKLSLEQANTEDHDSSPYRDLLKTFATEEKSPWQLFFERCRPLVCSGANGFLVKGSFWDSRCLESSETFDIFCRLMLAMRASLDSHRWHIMSTCLLSGPSAGLSEGKVVFHGPLGSPVAFLMHQCRMHAEAVEGHRYRPSSGVARRQSPMRVKTQVLSVPIVERRALHAMLLYRGDLSFPSYSCDGDNPCSATLSIEDWRRLDGSVQSVRSFLSRYAHEWGDLFLSRASSLTAALGEARTGSSSVVWTLPSWRIFWREHGASSELLDEELLTDLFQSASFTWRGLEQPYEEMYDSVRSALRDDGQSVIPVEVLPMYNWALYAGSGQRTPANAEASGSSFKTAAGYLLPCVEEELEPAIRSTQELGFYEWVEAMLRTICVAFATSGRAQDRQGNSKGPSVTSMTESIQWFTFSKIIGPLSVSGLSSHVPRQRLQQFVRGAYIEEVLRYHQGALVVIFEHYSKFRGPSQRNAQLTPNNPAVNGATIEFADWYAMIREAGAMSNGELNLAGMIEVFLAVGVEMRSHTQSPPTSKTLQQLSPYPPADPRKLSPASAAAAASAISKTTLLPLANFGLSLAILAQIKYPNPLRALHMRLHTFIAKHIETPLMTKLPILHAIVQQRKEGLANDLLE